MKNIIYKIMKPAILWDWYDFGLVLKISKNIGYSNYYFSVDIQIGWFNLWTEFIKKCDNGTTKGS